MSDAKSKSANKSAAAQPALALVPYSAPLLLPVIVFAIVLAVYASTVYPSVTGGDSGELIITACNLGIAHPPGYPTYSMIGWAWLQFTNLFAPLAQKAYRINMLCVIQGSFAAAFLAAATSALSSYTYADRPGQPSSTRSNMVAGAYAALGFAFMPTVWLYSIQGEVFALNNLLCAMLIALTVVYYRKETQVENFVAVGQGKKSGEGKNEDSKEGASSSTATSTPAAPVVSVSSSQLVTLAYMGAMLCGLCLTNQHTTVFPVIITSGFISWSLYTHGELSIFRVFALIFFVIVGFSPYAYTVIRSHSLVIDSWGDQRTFSGFMTHLLRAEYGTFQLAASEISQDPGMISRLGVYAQNMRHEMMIATPILAIIGLLSSVFSPSRAIRRTSIVLFFSYLLYVVVFHKLANLDLRPLFLGVQARFWQQCNMIIWVYAGVGIKTIAQFVQNAVVSKKKDEASATPSTAAAPSRMGFAIVAFYSIFYLSYQLYLQYPIHNHRANDSFYQQGVAMLNSFPPHSIVLLNGDLNNNLVKYPQQCEGVRPDLSLLSLQLMSWEWFVPVQRRNYPEVVFPGIRYHVSTEGSFNIKRFLDANKKNKKAHGGIFLCGPFKDGDHSNKRSINPDTNHYQEHPYGMCSQLLPYGEEPKNMSDFLHRGYSGVPRTSKLPPFEAWKYGEETWEMVLYKDLLSRLTYLTSFASFHSNRQMDDVALLEVAVELTEDMRKNEQLLIHHGLFKEYEYRSSGVIYGMYAKHLHSLGTKAAEKEAQIMDHRHWYAWYRYNQLKPNDPEIYPHLMHQVNPYSGQKIKGLDEQAWFHALPPVIDPPKKEPVKKEPIKVVHKKGSKQGKK